MQRLVRRSAISKCRRFFIATPPARRYCTATAHEHPLDREISSAILSHPIRLPLTVESGLRALRLPCVRIRGEDVHVLADGAQFYDEIIHQISQASRRITISSLYLGVGPHEEKMVAALDAALAREPGLQVNILLDFNRGQRQDGAGSSSITVMLTNGNHPTHRALTHRCSCHC